MTITTLPPRDPTLAPEPESAMKNGRIDLLDHGFVRLVDSMGDDLSVVRAARVSYDASWRAGEDQGSDKRLIGYLWKHRHTSPFEAVTFTFEVKAPICVFRQSDLELHRHMHDDVPAWPARSWYNADCASARLGNA